MPCAGCKGGQSGCEQEFGQRHWAGACEGHAESAGKALQALPYLFLMSEGSLRVGWHVRRIHQNFCVPAPTSRCM